MFRWCSDLGGANQCPRPTLSLLFVAPRSLLVRPFRSNARFLSVFPRFASRSVRLPRDPPVRYEPITERALPPEKLEAFGWMVFFGVATEAPSVLFPGIAGRS
jgi:hypothetical protein